MGLEILRFLCFYCISRFPTMKRQYFWNFFKILIHPFPSFFIFISYPSASLARVYLRSQICKIYLASGQCLSRWLWPWSQAQSFPPWLTVINSWFISCNSSSLHYRSEEVFVGHTEGRERWQEVNTEEGLSQLPRDGPPHQEGGEDLFSSKSKQHASS